jgi:hypothetical protein
MLSPLSVLQPALVPYPNPLAIRRISKDHPVVGRWPAETGPLPLETMNAVAALLRSLDGHINVVPSPSKKSQGATPLALPAMTVALPDGRSLWIQKAGSGDNSQCYQLRVNQGPPVALKVYHAPRVVDRHGNFMESGWGFLLKQAGVKDIVQPYVTHYPSAWQLNEWYDKTKPVEPGQRLVPWLKQQGFYYRESHEGNGVPGKNRRYFDLGGVQPEKRPMRSLAAFLQRWSQPENPQFLSVGSRIKDIVDPGQQKLATLLAFNSPLHRLQVLFRLPQIQDEPLKLQLMRAALADPASRPQAVFDLDKVPEDHRYSLLKQAFNTQDPQVAFQAARIIDLFPVKDRWSVFQQVMQTPDARPMAMRHVSSLPEKWMRDQAEDMATKDPGAHFVALSLSNQPNFLKAEALKALFQRYGLTLSQVRFPDEAQPQTLEQSGTRPAA